MDAAFKQYEYHPGIDIPEEMGFDAEAFVDDYISTFHEESPVELYQQQIIDYLAVNHPDLSYEDILRTRELQPERMGILPGTFPHKLLSRDDEYSEIPFEKRYQIRFHIYDSGASLDYTANLPEIAGKQVTISYVAATSDDQQIIDDAGGLFEVEDPWLVHLKPVLRIDGCEVATGSGEVLVGLTQKSDMYFMPPEGAQNRIPYVSNTIVAGTYQGVGLDTWRVAPSLSFSPSTTCEESYAAYLLHDTALMYLSRLDAANEEVAKTMQMVVTNDVAEAIVEHIVEVTYNGYGIPMTFEWASVRIDADRDIVASFSVTGDSESKEFMRLTGADSSIMENRVFEDEYDTEAISAVKTLELANDMGIPVYEVDSSNVSTILPMLTVSSSVKDWVSNAVSIGHVVTIPRENITYYDWTGTGFVDMDPVTCAAANIISGGFSGGQPVKELIWTWHTNDCIDAQITSMTPTMPDAPEPYDITQITHIYLPEDQASLSFKTTITPYHWPSSGHPCWAKSSYERTFDSGPPRPKPNTIEGLAKKYGLGEYKFDVGTEQADCSECGTSSQTFWIGVKVTEFTVSDDNHDISRTSPGASEMYVPENIPEGADSGDATITIQDVRIYPETDRAEIWSRVLWKVTGDGVGSPSSGSFGPGVPAATVTLTPTQSNRQYRVEVGFDADNNGELDANEVSKDENEDPLAITVYVVKVLITEADVTQEETGIQVELAPPSLTGTFTLELLGETTHPITSELRSGGTHGECFDVPSLVVAEYTQVKATWEVG
jgi:hypothetical protein